MSEVTRYLAPALIHGRNIMKSAEGFSVVSAAHYDEAQSQLAALREELAQRDSFEELYNAAIDERDAIQQRLADAERRNASTIGSVTKCRICESDDLFWFAQNTVRNGIQQNRLNTHDVECVFVLGCNNCSETLKLVSADKIAGQMTAALAKPEEAKS